MMAAGEVIRMGEIGLGGDRVREADSQGGDGVAGWDDGGCKGCPIVKGEGGGVLCGGT